MTSPPEPPNSVGHQLAKRREELDLTQGTLAGRVGVTVTAISNAERGRATISRGKRPLWEKALHLKAGTISRAYRDGSPIEALEPVPDDRPYPDPSDPAEVAAWTMDLSESDRRELITMARELAARKRREQSA